MAEVGGNCLGVHAGRDEERGVSVAGSPAVFASFELVDGGGVSYAGSVETPAFRVVEGNALVISNAAGVDCLGHITYALKRGRG
jgi:hypothetical protein